MLLSPLQSFSPPPPSQRRRRRSPSAVSIESIRASVAELELVAPASSSSKVTAALSFSTPAVLSRPSADKGKRKATSPPKADSSAIAAKPLSKKARKGETSSSAVPLEELPPLPLGFQLPVRKMRNKDGEVQKLRQRLHDGQQLIPAPDITSSRLSLREMKQALSDASTVPLVSFPTHFLFFIFILYFINLSFSSQLGRAFNAWPAVSNIFAPSASLAKPAAHVPRRSAIAALSRTPPWIVKRDELLHMAQAEARLLVSLSSLSFLSIFYVPLIFRPPQHSLSYRDGRLRQAVGRPNRPLTIRAAFRSPPGASRRLRGSRPL
jgi:hypothetical protein